MKKKDNGMLIVAKCFTLALLIIGAALMMSSDFDSKMPYIIITCFTTLFGVGIIASE